MSCSLRCEQGPWSKVCLENEAVRVVIIPELGGKIWSLFHKQSGKEWIWHNPNIPLRQNSYGASYDDNWAGGWEELFPNDAAGEFHGAELPDHGEWWSQSWGYSVVENGPRAVSLQLTLRGRATPTQCEKLIKLEEGASEVNVSYRICNCGSLPLDFLFKQHLALELGPDYALELPNGSITPVDLNFSRRIGQQGPFNWPFAKDRAGGIVDLSELPAPHSNSQEFIYVEQLSAGWCGARHRSSGHGIRMHFDLRIYPYTWMFMTFGGWRDLYTVVLEPCTNMPKDLKAAFAAGRCAHLESQQSLETSVRVVLD